MFLPRDDDQEALEQEKVHASLGDCHVPMELPIIGLSVRLYAAHSCTLMVLNSKLNLTED